MANYRNKKTNQMQELQYRILFVLFAVVVFRVGAHIPLPGIDLDQLSQLFQDNLRDSALTPMCSVPSSQRDCSGISATCEGNVAKVCVGGKLQSVDCSSVLPGGVCVLQTGNSEIDVRCRSTD